MRIILVVNNEQFQETYITCLKPYDIELDIVANLTELHQQLGKENYSGIFLDLPSFMHGSLEEKSRLHNALQSYPVMRLRLVEDEMMGMFIGQKSDITSISDFINLECMNFDGRRIRRWKRMDLHIHVLIARNETQLLENPETSVTFNISEQGCFLISFREWKMDEPVWMLCETLSYEKPLKGIVRRKLLWGEGMGVPGVGIEFDTMPALFWQQVIDAIGSQELMWNET